MAKKFLTAIDLAKNELQNPQIHNLASAPSSPVKGQMYMNTSDNTLYWWDGTAWASARGGGTGFPGFGSVTQEQTFGATKNDGVGTTTARNDHTHGNPVHDAAAHSTIPLSALAAPTANVSMGNFLITNLASPLSVGDAATKQYVDQALAGLSWKDAARAATTANITLSGLQTVDGVSLASQDRVLVKNQTTASQNGIYQALSTGWVRTSDSDSQGDILNAAVFVSEGTTLADTAWVCSTNAPITIDTTSLTWVQFTGAASVSDGDKGDITVSGGGATWTIDAGVVTNTKLANMPANTFKANSGGVGAPSDLTVSQTKILIGTATSTEIGMAPAYGGSPAGSYLSNNLTWTVPPGTATGTVKKYATSVGGATSAVVNHALSTTDVTVEVFRVASPFDSVECDIEHTDANNVTLRFTTAPAASEYRCVVTG